MRSIVFVGQSYYNAYFLNQELRDQGHDTLLINIDSNHERNSTFYWGQDTFLPNDAVQRLELYLTCINRYKYFHFANRGGISFLSFKSSDYVSKLRKKIKLSIFNFSLWLLRIISQVDPLVLISLLKYFGLIEVQNKNVKFKIQHSKILKALFVLARGLPENWDILILKALRKVIIYTNNGCQDGVTPSSFSKWGPYNVCSICVWNGTSTCTNEDAIKWGKFRNSVSDFQILSGGNRADFNKIKLAYEVPEYYCLDKELWKPDLEVPQQYKLKHPDDVIKIYHSVGNYSSRTSNGVNIKCSHIYFPLIEELKREGFNIELVFCEGIANKDVRYIMAQCDIVVDMLTYGWFGANIREAMMLGIPSICFIRPEWLEDVRKEIPDYADELPIISACPDTIRDTLKKVIIDKKLRNEIGKRSREFAVKWHSKQAGMRRMEKIYEDFSV